MIWFLILIVILIVIVIVLVLMFVGLTPENNNSNKKTFSDKKPKKLLSAAGEVKVAHLLEMRKVRKREQLNSKDKSICTDCGSVGSPKKKLSGSLGLDAKVWFLMLILAFFTGGISILIAVVYSLSRYVWAKMVCEVCEGKMIGIATPEGATLLQKYGEKEDT